MDVEKAVNLADIARLAKLRLPRIIFDFAMGGVEDEEGLAHNRRAFSRYRLTPRYGVDVSHCDTAVSLFGKSYASPIGIAPMGIAGLFRRGAELMFAQAAAAANVPYVMSTASTVTLEAVAAVAPDNLWFQLYGTNTRSVGHDLVRRAKDAGVSTLVVTMDTPANAKRERNIRNGFSYPPKLTARTLLDGLAHPAWSWEFLTHGGVPLMENLVRYAPRGTPNGVASYYAAQNPSASQTWRDVEAVRALWPGPLLVKGLLHPADAARAVELGADGVYVSNHGARQLDRAPSPVEMLPAIRAAIGDKPRLVMDSGVRRGSDVILAVCLGADISFIGRPAIYGVAAGGALGVRRAIDILEEELRLTMGQIGCTALSDLGPHTLFDGEASRAQVQDQAR